MLTYHAQPSKHASVSQICKHGFRLKRLEGVHGAGARIEGDGVDPLRLGGGLRRMRAEVGNTTWTRGSCRCFWFQLPIYSECFDMFWSNGALLDTLMAEPRVTCSFCRLRWSVILPY